MRNLWYEVNPEYYQDEPEDNTSVFCREQVRVWAGGGKTIHPEIATEIASWWHTPARGNPFNIFQSSGLVTADLKDSIRLEIATCAMPPPHTEDEDWQENIMDLLALYAYVCGAPQPQPLTYTRV